MEFFSKAKGLLDVVTGGPIAGQTGVLISKYEHDKITSGSILQVMPTQEAVFYKSGGGGFEILGPGEYPVETKLIPFLHPLMNLKFAGKKTPYTTHIWFINKTVDHRFEVGTPEGSKVMAEDPRYEGIMLTLGANATVMFKVADTKTLFHEAAGTPAEFGIEHLEKLVKDMVRADIKGILQRYVTKMKNQEDSRAEGERRSFQDMLGDNEILEEIFREAVQLRIERYGLTVAAIAAELIIRDDDNYREVQQHNAELMRARRSAKKEDIEEMARIEREAKRLQMMGVNYATDRQLDVAQTFAGNEGSGATNVAGMGAGIGMMGVMANQMQTAMQPAMMQQPMQQPPAPAAGGVNCPACGVSQAPAKFCSECGAAMEKKCPSCGTGAPPTQKFCNECGSPMEKKCACGATPAPGQKFCNECGAKI